MGRPRQKIPDPTAHNAVHLNALVSVCEGEMVRAAATARGLSIAEFIREQVLPAAREEHLLELTNPTTEKTS